MLHLSDVEIAGVLKTVCVCNLTQMQILLANNHHSKTNNQYCCFNSTYSTFSLPFYRLLAAAVITTLYWYLDSISSIFQEKDDLEARFNEVNAKAEQASSQQALVQQELERARQQASEALRSMDAERHQLRSANNK